MPHLRIRAACCALGAFALASAASHAASGDFARLSQHLIGSPCIEPGVSYITPDTAPPDRPEHAAPDRRAGHLALSVENIVAPPLAPASPTLWGREARDGAPPPIDLGTVIALDDAGPLAHRPTTLWD